MDKSLSPILLVFAIYVLWAIVVNVIAHHRYLIDADEELRNKRTLISLVPIANVLYGGYLLFVYCKDVFLPKEKNEEYLKRVSSFDLKETKITHIEKFQYEKSKLNNLIDKATVMLSIFIEEVKLDTTGKKTGLDISNYTKDLQDVKYLRDLADTEEHLKAATIKLNILIDAMFSKTNSK